MDVKNVVKDVVFVQIFRLLFFKIILIKPNFNIINMPLIIGK